MPFEQRQHLVAHCVRCSSICQAWMNAKWHASGTYGVRAKLAVIQFGSQCDNVRDHGVKGVDIGREARETVGGRRKFWRQDYEIEYQVACDVQNLRAAIRILNDRLDDQADFRQLTELHVNVAGETGCTGINADSCDEPCV